MRAAWDEQNAKWWFSVLDIVASLTYQDDYTKTRNYWKYLKAKLKKENSQVVSATTQLKFLARLHERNDAKSNQKYCSKNTFGKALTTKINDLEMFMKGIDYSYYYEEND